MGTNDERRANYAECLTAVDSLLNDAACAETAEERSAVLAAARGAASACLSADPDDAELNYAMGLVSYHAFAENEADRSEAELYLKRASEIDPRHQFARLYLGHLYYDVAEYDKALPYFESIQADYFLSLQQRWRVLKARELLLCCKVYLNDPGLTLNSFSSLVQEYLAGEPEDVPVPLELLTAVRNSEGSATWTRVDKTQVEEMVVGMFRGLGYERILKEHPPS